MSLLRKLFFLVPLVCLPSLASGQPWGFPSAQYPATPYQNYSQPGGNGFATSPPVTPDGGPDSNETSDHSMSPDSWSVAPSGGEFKGAFPAATPTPSVPDLKAQSPFSNAAFGQPFPTEAPQQVTTPSAQNESKQFVPKVQFVQPTPSRAAGTAIRKRTGPRRYPLVGWKNSPFRANAVHATPADAIRQPPGTAFDAVEDWYRTPDPNAATAQDANSDQHESPPAPLEANAESSTQSPQASGSGFGWAAIATPNPNPGQPPFGQQGVEYRPDLGQREPDPTVRNFGSYDNGQAFDFETKKRHQPSLRETLKTGRYFGSVGVLYVKPAFQANTAITTSGLGTGESIPFDFDYESGPMIRFGFESKQGPGVEVSYWRYDETSNVATFTSDGTITGTVSTWMLGPHRWSQLSAINAGESIATSHNIDVDSVNASFFKQVQLPISRINGRFGFQWATVRQFMDATLSDSGGTIAEMRTRSDLQGFGPSFAFEYYRPIGHSKLEIMSSVGGSLLFGHRDQFVHNSQTGDFNRIGADEFLTTADLLIGLQYKKMVAENRGFFARFGLTYQTWMGGGTAVEPEGDFGLRGFSFTLGYNR